MLTRGTGKHPNINVKTQIPLELRSGVMLPHIIWLALGFVLGSYAPVNYVHAVHFIDTILLPPPPPPLQKTLWARAQPFYFFEFSTWHCNKLFTYGLPPTFTVSTRNIVNRLQLIFTSPE